MTKVLTIDGKEVGFRASALVPRLYRHKMGRDIVRDLNALKKSFDKALKATNAVAPVEPPEDADDETVAQYLLDLEAYEEATQDAQLSVLDLEIFENVAYIMARHYDPKLPSTPEEWLEGFDVFSIYEILPEILALWNLQEKTTSVPKNG